MAFQNFKSSRIQNFPKGDFPRNLPIKHDYVLASVPTMSSVTIIEVRPEIENPPKLFLFAPLMPSHPHELLTTDVNLVNQSNPHIPVIFAIIML